MRLLHTSDWHLGRAFHEHSTLEAAREVLGAIPGIVRERGVDAVLVAGDVYDVANPSADAVRAFQQAVLGILEAGAAVVMSTGNHDSAARLGVVGAFSAASGLHVAADPAAIATPFELRDEHGPVDVYGIPYLQPELVRRVAWVPEGAGTQRDVVQAAMGEVRTAIAARRTPGRRSVVLAHTFVAGGQEEPFPERRISRPLAAGGVDAVPVDVFADAPGVDYVALGHLHGRGELAPHVRYSGAPLHYSFKEAGSPRGGWLVDLGADRTAVEWVDLPVPRPLKELRGTLDELRSDPRWDAYAEHYVRAVYTDRTRQLEPMRKLKARFPWCAEVVHEFAGAAEERTGGYRERVRGKTDAEIVASFLADVRGGEAMTAEEAAVVDAALAVVEAGAQAR